LLTVFPWRLRGLFVHEVLDIVGAMERGQRINHFSLGLIELWGVLVRAGYRKTQGLMAFHLIKRGCCIHINRIKLLYCGKTTKSRFGG